MPPTTDHPTTLHSFMALFQTNDFRSHCLLRDLEANFDDFQFFIVWDQYNPRAAAEFLRYPQLRPIEKQQLFDFIAQTFEVETSTLVTDCRNFPLLLRILLAIYLRRAIRIDYCIMTDNDIFFFDTISEVVGLSATHTPFLIQETGAADILPEITEYISRCLCKDIRYVPPSKGRGYNAGFCGLDLSVFDAFDRDTLRSLLETLRQMPQWWREQAFFVNMTFTSPKAVHTFARDRYMFLPSRRDLRRLTDPTPSKEAADPDEDLPIARSSARRRVTSILVGTHSSHVLQGARERSRSPVTGRAPLRMVCPRLRAVVGAARERWRAAAPA